MSIEYRHRDIIASLTIAAAWSDGSICDNEKRAIERVLQHLQYQPSEIAERLAASVVQPELDTISVPDDAALRLAILRYAMAVVLADGELEKDEVAFLKRLTDRLGVSPQVLTILRLEAEHLASQTGLPGPDSLIKRVEALLPESL